MYIYDFVSAYYFMIIYLFPRSAFSCTQSRVQFRGGTVRHHYTLKSSLELLDVGRFGCRANKTTFDDIYVICLKWRLHFFVSKSEHKSCTKPTDALPESKVIGPLHILSSCKNNTFWHQQFLQWVGGQLKTLSNNVFTFVQLAWNDDFKIWCLPDMCATYCSFFPFFQPLPPLNSSISFAMPRLAVKLIFLSGDSEDESLIFKPDAKPTVSWFWVHGGLGKRKTHPLNGWFSHIFGRVSLIRSNKPFCSACFS